jgi:hypothetical protein
MDIEQLNKLKEHRDNLKALVKYLQDDSVDYFVGKNFIESLDYMIVYLDNIIMREEYLLAAKMRVDNEIRKKM